LADNKQNRKLNSDVLDLIETRFIDGCLGDAEVSASVLEILRRVLHYNARLTTGIGDGMSGKAASLETPGGEGEGEDTPDYGGKILNFK